MTFRELVSRWGRVLAALAVVAVAAALLVAVSGIAQSIPASSSRLATTIDGDARLEVSGVTDSGFDQSLVSAVAVVNGVQAAVPMVRMQQGQAGDMLLLGVDMSVAALHSDLQRALEDQLAGTSLVSLADRVVVGSGTGAHKGDRIRLGDRQVEVAAVVGGAVANRVNSGRFAITSLPLVQAATGRVGSVDSILIVPARNANPNTLREQITRAVAGRAVVGDPMFRAAQARGGFAVLEYTSLILATISLVVASFLIYNVMSMSITQRRRTFSMLRALGAMRRTIVTDLLLEAVGIGLLGGTIGVIAGMVVGHIAIRQLPPAVVGTLEARLEFVLSPWSWVLSVLACTCASVLAAALAARQVYRVSPIEALTEATVDVGDSVKLVPRVLIGGGSVVLIGAAAVVAVVDVGRYAMLAIGLSMVGSIGLCFGLSAVLVRVTAAAARLFGPVGIVAAATIDRSPKRVWATAMTVFVAITTTVAITGADDNVVDSITGSYATVAGADQIISSSAPGVFPTVLLPNDLLAKAAAVPGVQKVLSGQGVYAALGDTKVLIQAAEPGMRNGLFEAAGESTRQQLYAGQGVILSRDVARSMSVSAGDQVDLPTPTGVHRVKVLAVVSFFGGLTGTVGMNLDELREWFHRPGSACLEVVLAPNADAGKVESALRQQIPADLHIYSGSAAVAGIAAGTRQLTALFGSIAWIVVLIAGVAVLNTLMLSVLERRREIGVLRAIGSTVRLAVGSVVTEAGAIGLIGGVLGLIAGCANQYLIVTALADMLDVQVSYRPSVVMLGFGVTAVALCLLGAVPPAIRVARLDILEAIGVG
ncbi:ABC transporter permease [Nocardia sp. NPDC101769]|uniref:ABC transporter permease n=1 Tax=Nocardia sp. NPDC101769 TaxID=3364333 RepID=UPI0037F43758